MCVLSQIIFRCRFIIRYKIYFPMLYSRSLLFIYFIYNSSESGLATQLCPTLWGCMDCSPLGSSVNGISKARRLEWVAIPFSKGSSQPRDRTQVSCSASGLRLYRQILYYWATREVPYVSINSKFLIYPTPFPLWHSKVCFLCLWVYFCF